MSGLHIHTHIHVHVHLIVIKQNIRVPTSSEIFPNQAKNEL